MQWRRWKEEEAEEKEVEKVKAGEMKKEVEEKDELFDGVTCRTGC